MSQNFYESVAGPRRMNVSICGSRTDPPRMQGFNRGCGADAARSHGGSAIRLRCGSVTARKWTPIRVRFTGPFRKPRYLRGRSAAESFCCVGSFIRFIKELYRFFPKTDEKLWPCLAGESNCLTMQISQNAWNSNSVCRTAKTQTLYGNYRCTIRNAPGMHCRIASACTAVWKICTANRVCVKQVLDIPFTNLKYFAFAINNTKINFDVS